MRFTIEIASEDLDEERPEVLIDFVAEDTDSPPIEEDNPAWKDFEAKQGKTLRLYRPEEVPAERWILIGLGDEQPTKREAYELGGTVYRQLDGLSVGSASVRLDGFPNRTNLQEALVAGISLGAYKYEEHKSDQTDADEDEVTLETITLRGGVKQLDPDEIRWITDSVNRARDLANAPANDLTPERLAGEARRLEQECDRVSVEVWDEERLAEENMNLHLSVSRGSGRPGRLIHLSYDPDAPKSILGLAGKGVTFDTGGISLKPSKKMHEMKYDMCGAATVLGFVRAAAGSGLPVRIEALVPAVENMPGERATCPGDVIEGRNGTTVEIINTDAEGRLILADSLALLSERHGDELDLLVDLATLTGACIGALGHEAAGLMTPGEDWSEPFQQAGESCGERVWPFPLWEEYEERLESETADVKNVGGKPGAILAGLFLQNFVEEDLRDRWVHLDIAGVGWGMSKKPHRPKGGTGFGVMLLLELVREELI